MPNEDKQFFELLKNEGMEGVLKQWELYTMLANNNKKLAKSCE